MPEKNRVDLEETRKQELKEVFQTRIAFAEKTWLEAGQVGGEALKGAIGTDGKSGFETYREIQELMTEINRRGVKFSVDETSAAMRKRVVFGETEVIAVPFLYEECSGFRLQGKEGKAGVGSLEISWTGRSWVYLAQVIGPGEGAVEVKVKLFEQGQIERITFKRVLTEQQMNVPGAFVRQRTTRSGEIIPGLQIAEGPPQL